MDSSANPSIDGDPPKLWPAAIAVVLWIGLLIWAGKAGWQHLSLGVLIWACLTREAGPRRFVRDWTPLILFWLSYDGMRLLEPWILPRVDVRGPFRWEKALFSLPSGEILPFFFTDLSSRASSLLSIHILRAYCDFVYLTQLWAIPAVAFFIWHRHSDVLFRRIVWSFTALHIMTMVIYLCYPAAPPWWVYENGFKQPSLEHSFPDASVDNRTLAVLFHLSANRFAAIPSLHGAYPLLLVSVLWTHGVDRKLVFLSSFYAVSMWFACVFLNQHYIVDLALGAFLAGVAFIITRSVMR